MGASQSVNTAESIVLGKHTTAREVVIKFGGQGSLAGKTAIVTGGSSGIGTETVKQLVWGGCDKVITTGRNIESGKAALIAAGVDMSKVEVCSLDLEDLASVKAFGEKCAQEARIDFLVLNAAIMAVPNLEYTKNGWEKQIGTNHFGHFYLTSFLKDKMKAQPFPCRIVAVSSLAHSRGEVDVKDLHFKNGRTYTPWVSYGQSKSANILFIRQLADEMADSKVCCVSLHPGVIHTNLIRQMVPNDVLREILLFCFGGLIFDKTIEQGTSTTMTACLDPSLDTKEARGSYLSDCKILETEPHCRDESKELRRELWRLTEEQVAEATSALK